MERAWLSESKRNLYKRRLSERLKERERNDRGRSELDIFCDGINTSSTISSDINGMMRLTSEALRAGLLRAGMRDLWLLNRSNIYERAITNLGMILDIAPLPGFLQRAVSQETILLANSLLVLFTGGVRLHVTKSNDISTIFSGYFEHLDNQTKRISIMQRHQKGYHPRSRREIYPNCQILIREIEGRSNRGGAIAGSDQRIRCGLRFGSMVADYKWCVSINSGISASEANHDLLLRNVGPITRAYNESRTYPESFYYLQETDTINTFHYQDPHEQTISPFQGGSKFSVFNRFLHSVFMELSRH